MQNKKKAVAHERRFGLFEVDEQKKAESKSYDNEVSHVVSYLGEKANGGEINDLILGFGVYPDIDPSELQYFPEKEEHFWMLARDCSIIGLLSKNSRLVANVTYLPIFDSFPKKHYAYRFPQGQEEEVFKKLLKNTEAPVVIRNESLENLKVNEVLLKLLELRLNRTPKLFKPSSDEKSILKMKENRSTLKYALETTWLPRKDKKIINHCLALSSGFCIFCRTLDKLFVNGSVIDNGYSRIAIIYQICKNCIAGTQETIYEKLIKHLSESSPELSKHKFTYVSRADYFKMIKDKITKEGFSFTSQSKKNNSELHIAFEKDCMLIIRYNNMLDYAYIILKGGKEVFKWDAAMHHELQSGPDHHHYDIKDYNKNVKSSYLIGNFLMDFDTVMTRISDLIDKKPEFMGV